MIRAPLILSLKLDLAVFGFGFEPELDDPVLVVAAATPIFELIGLATEVVVKGGVPSLNGKLNDGLAVLADCQKDEKADSELAMLTVDMKPIRAGSEA